MKNFLLEKFPHVPFAVKILILSLSVLLIGLLLLSFFMSRDTRQNIVPDNYVSGETAPQVTSPQASQPVPTHSTQITATPSPTPTMPANCFVINQNTIDALSLGINGLTVTQAFGYTDPRRDDFYFVVADLTGEGVQPGDIQGVWATSDKLTTENYDGVMLAVDATAIASSVLPDGSTTDADFSSDESAVIKSLNCLN